MAIMIEDRDLIVLTMEKFLEMSGDRRYLHGILDLQIKGGGSIPTSNVCLRVYAQGQILHRGVFTAPELLGQVDMFSSNDQRRIWIVLERGGELIVRHHFGTHGNERIIARGWLAS